MVQELRRATVVAQGLPRKSHAQGAALGMQWLPPMVRPHSTLTDTRDPETYEIIGAAMAVHNELGCGFLEKVYAAALPIEFARRNIPFSTNVLLSINYQGTRLPVDYYVDFLCHQTIIVEIKALDAVGDLEVAQVINYLKAARIRRGLLINFGAPSLQCRRLVYG
jgi:GxxExxY protein